MDRIKVKLLHITPMSVALEALKKPYKNDKVTEDLFNKVIKVDKHKSVMEHLVFNFEIDGISRLCLQELARHRIASLTVQSTRFTLQELAKDPNPEIHKYFVIPTCLSHREKEMHEFILSLYLKDIKDFYRLYQASNDVLKYFLPESFRTSLVWTVNARSLLNFLNLRTSEKAHFEIRHLANLIKKELADYEIFN